MSKTKLNILKDWTETDLDKVLKGLKSKQSQDSNGWANEIFNLKNIGFDLKSSLLLIFNKIKNTLEIPSFFQDTLISAIPKKRKCQADLKSTRGIFLINKVRMIFMKLLFNTNIQNIENNLSNSNIGGRKGKSARDHLFVLFSIISEIRKNKNSKCIDLVWYDLASCFDGLWGSKTYLDLYSNGVQDNSLNLIQKINENASIAIKTPVGISSKSEVKNKILQGENFSSILCTSTLDVMSKECPIEPYKYKNSVNIPNMGFLDDIMNVTYCGFHTSRMNMYINEEISKRKLHFSYDKCKRMHIGKKTIKCKNIHVDKWKTICQETKMNYNQKDSYEGKLLIEDTTEHLYLGEVICPTLSNNANIALKISKCQGIKNDILFILNNTYYGDNFFDIVKLLRNSMFLSVLLGNAEIWHNVTKKNLKSLEACDRMFLAQIMGTSNKGSYVLMLLEGGLLPIKELILQKRLSYFHSLLKSDNRTLGKQVLNEQMKYPKEQNWTNQAFKDLNELKIFLSSEEIQHLSKFKFKKILKDACYKSAFNNLLMEKQKLSKGCNLRYSSLKTQNYLKSGTELTTQDIKQIYTIRTRNLYLKTNFPGMFSDDKCVNINCEERDTEYHLFYVDC